MSKRRYKVPEGMYQAALPYQDSSIQCSAALIAAVQWLFENIQPTWADAARWLDAVQSLPRGEVPHALTNHIDAWLREQFVESIQESFSIETPFGRIEIDARVPPGEIRLHNWNGPTVVHNISPAPDPDAPLRDLLIDDDPPDSPHCYFQPSTYNRRLREAFLRGKGMK